uniref:Uncharacterized protein n=1 Tax=Leersia perrieri TaxID=77586 RepID=A0A0D9XS72_9ORYZ
MDLNAAIVFEKNATNVQPPFVHVYCKENASVEPVALINGNNMSSSNEVKILLGFESREKNSNLVRQKPCCANKELDWRQFEFVTASTILQCNSSSNH